MKKLLTKFVLCGIALCTSLVGYAQGQIEGYFRVQNAGTKWYVEVTGPFSGAPDVQNYEDAETNAGTIMHITAHQEGDHYKITSLRSQGIEVVGDYLDDYNDVLLDIIMSSNNINFNLETLWTLVRGGFEHGYTSIGRALIQTMIWMVADRLDQEGISDAESQELANFALRFNDEVARNIDLGLRLKRDGEKFMLYYETPDLQCVSDWYLKQEDGKYINKETFEKGFESMRKYLMGTLGATGEGLDPSELKEMKSWGYDPTLKHNTYNEDGDVLYVTYEDIFADHELLFNWLKLNVIKFTDVNRCPKITLRGFYLPNFAEEMQNHELSKQIISYLPRLQTNQRIYLTDYKNGVKGHFDFISEEGAMDLEDYAKWLIVPMDNENQRLKVNHNKSLTKNEETTYYSALYYDFPVTAAEPNDQLSTLSLESVYKGYNFVKLLDIDQAGIQEPFVVSSSNKSSYLNVGDSNPILEDLEIFEEPDGFGIYDDVVSKQYVRRRTQESADTEGGTNDKFTGILLATSYDRDALKNYRDIDLNKTDLYFLDNGRDFEDFNNNYLVFSENDKLTSIPANIAFYTPYSKDYLEKLVIVGIVDLIINVGDTDSGEEETDHPDENEHIRIAQAFEGTGANVFEGLVSFSAELEYGKDFVVEVTVPEKVNSEDWMSPLEDDDLTDAYLKAFLEIQPAPEGEDQYTPGLYQQYLSMFGENETVENMSDDFVDGFFLSSHLDADETAMLEEPSIDDKSYYNYDLTFDAPCSGLYEIAIKPSEGSVYEFAPSVHKVKIYPNLYATFGENKTPGFNISGYQFTKDEIEGRYIINLPKTTKDADGKDVEFKLDNLIGYTPGTYFASSITATAGDDVKQSKVRRAADGSNDAYFVKLPDLTNIANTDTPLSVTIEKNGVAATYDFYIKTTTNPDNVTTGVDTIGTEEDAEAVYYNLHGVKVSNPEHGIFLKKVNGKTVKVII